MARSPGGGDDDVPRLPRGRGMKFSTPEILRILLFAGMLVAVIVLAKPCGNAVSGFVMKFDNGSNAAGSGSGSGRGSGGGTAQMPKPGNVEPPGKPVPVQTLKPEQYEHLRPGMSEQEIKAAMERARERAAAEAAGTGTGSATGTGSGTAAGTGTGSGTGTGARP